MKIDLGELIDGAIDKALEATFLGKDVIVTGINGEKITYKVASIYYKYDYDHYFDLVIKDTNGCEHIKYCSWSSEIEIA